MSVPLGGGRESVRCHGERRGADEKVEVTCKGLDITIPRHEEVADLTGKML